VAKVYVNNGEGNKIEVLHWLAAEGLLLFCLIKKVTKTEHFCELMNASKKHK